MKIGGRFAGKLKRVGQCVEWHGASSAKGYGRFGIGGKLYSPHRIVMQLSLPELFEGRTVDVCHVCDNPRCIRLRHLFVGTRRENMIDAYNKGRLSMPKGVPFAAGDGRTKERSRGGQGR